MAATNGNGNGSTEFHGTLESSGAITPAGRFARMEASLERIEGKLDQKSDIADYLVLEARVVILEKGALAADVAIGIAKASSDAVLKARVDQMKTLVVSVSIVSGLAVIVSSVFGVLGVLGVF